MITKYLFFIFLLFPLPSTAQHVQMYVPVHALRESDMCSVLSIAFPPSKSLYWKRRVDMHNSRRTMLYFLLSIKETANNKNVLHFINECYPNFDWTDAKTLYLDLKNQSEPYEDVYQATEFGTYWELETPYVQNSPLIAREYISRYRSKGFQANELKIYWNYEEIRSITTCNNYNPVTDSETRRNLLKSPVSKRKHSGTIQFIQSGIQDAVFRVPDGKQVIVLDFADERMPGGYFLEGAITQEEVILFNSDGYRAILDLKYRMMDGGYMLPEYGLAYIKHVRFFQMKSNNERLTDLIVAACYDLSGVNEGLYAAPANGSQELRSRTRQKFQAIIASAVANTEGDGSNTYLLLGPIGTGAFSNDKTMIAELFFEVLQHCLMNSKHAIRYAFDQIWFVSIDTLQDFEKVFSKI